MNTAVEGFSELVRRYEYDDTAGVPATVEEIWAQLAYPTFLGATTKSAQAMFLSGLLGDYLDYAHRSRAATDAGWSREPLEIIKVARSMIPRNSSGDALKRVALSSAEKILRTGDLANLVATAEAFFDKHSINPATLRALRGNTPKQKDLVASASREVHMFGYTKATLWLYGCGLGEGLTPPNHHIRRFLKAWEIRASSLASLDLDAEDDAAFAIVCDGMNDVARQVSVELGRPVTVRRVQYAAWLWQSCISLLAGHRKGNRLTVRRLLDFLDSTGWTPSTLEDIISDVERVEDIERQLSDFA